jgi:hypothetical protein
MKVTIVYTKKHIIALALFSALAFSLSAQETKTRPTRQSSLEVYSKGDYEKAYAEFSELLAAYPRDPLYMYYSGVCLVRLQREPVKAVAHLQQAKQNAAQLRSVPPDVSFWLGRAQQFAGSYDDAVLSFEDFTAQAGRKTAKDMSVPEFIEQCRSRKGALDITVSKADVPARMTAESIPSEEKSVADVPVKIIPSANNNAKVLKDTSLTVPGDFDKALSEAMDYQVRADSMNRALDSREKQLDKLPYARKVEERAAIEVEKRAADSLQTLAMKKFDQAQASVNSTTFVAGTQVVKQTPDSVQHAKREEKQLIAKPEQESTRKVAPSNPVTKTAQIQDTVKPEAVTVAKSVPVFSVFEVKQVSASDDGNKIEIDPEIPVGLIYRIQIAVFRNPVVRSYFKGITPIYGFRSPGKDVTIYYAGMFRKLTDANKALVVVRQKGFKDAFIASFMEGKAVSAERASLLEKEWGNKPLSDIVNETAAPADTIPPTLAFRVEVMRSPKPVREDVFEGLKKSAGARGLDTETLADGTSVYLIGRFITYESAEEFANLLIRNGYRDSRVGAWLGKKEIPVDTAKHLFEQIDSL